MALLEQKLPITRIVTMVQKEVAERMVAPPGGKDYGALSVAVQYYTEPEFALNVPPRCFMPAPAVDSAVMDCVVRTAPPVEVKDENQFFRVVKAAFGQRRKTLSNALTGVGISTDEVKIVLEKAGVDGNRRGETLSLTEFAALADAVSEL